MKTILGIVVLIAWTILSWQRVPVYSSDLALWTDAVRLNPQIPRPWVNLGQAWMQWGSSENAVSAWKRALEDAGNRSLPWVDAELATITAAQNIGAVYAFRGDRAEAAAYFEIALRAQAAVQECQRTIAGC